MKDKFKDYLLSIGDEETIRKLMGGILRISITKVEMITEEKYEQTKDEVYLLYSDQYRQISMRGIILVILLFALLIFYVVKAN